MNAPTIATITVNPAIDQTVLIPNFTAGEVNRVESEQLDPAGKGVNVAAFLSTFGYRVSATGFLGIENADVFTRFFAEKQIDDRFIRIAGKTRVNVKIIDPAQKKITDVNFPGQTANDSDVAKLAEVVDDLAKSCEWFVISGSVPAGMSAGIYRDLAAELKGKGKTVVLDASGESLRLAIPVAPYALKPNIAELQELEGTSLNTEKEVIAAARDLLDRGISFVAVSMGARGAIFLEGDEVVAARPPAVDVKSTVGAGDAMVAGLIVGKLRGFSLANCARLATAFSLGTLSLLGPRLPPREVVESLAEQVTLERL